MIKNKKNFTEGPLFFRITLFALPIMLTGALQIVYNMADNIVVGKFSGDELALGAVGCTSSLTNLIVNLLLGIAAGSGVVISQLYGSGEAKRVSRAVHTAMVFSLFGGIFIGALGLIISRPVLTLMGTNEAIIDNAVLYFRIICIGIPASSVYNFGASVLRSTGDSKTPLIILASTGIVNVLLNLFFVIVCRMSVAGVAIATIIAQYLSAVGVVLILIFKKKGECFAFSFKLICFDSSLFKRIIRLGLPAGFQSSMFSISNVLLASAINTFPPITVSANTIASQVDAITYVTMNSFSQAVMTFAGQNYGAKRADRVKKSFIYCLIQITVFGIAISRLELLFKRELASLFVDMTSPNANLIIETSLSTITLLLNTYIFCGLMDIISCFMRGIGFSILPMIISLTGICGIRLIWIYTVFPLERFNTYSGLMLSYPVSWVITLIAFSIAAIFAFRRLRTLEPDGDEAKPMETAA